VSGFFTLTNAIGGPKAGGDFYLGARRVQLEPRSTRPQAGGELSYNKTIQDTLLNNYGVSRSTTRSPGTRSPIS
jgi:hypothetical protein